MSKKTNKDFTNEKELLSTLKNIKRKRKENEINLYKEVIKIIKDVPGSDKRKDLLIKLINNIDKDVEKLNPYAFATEVNILFTNLLLLAKSVDKKVPSEIIIPLLNIKDEPEIWLNNLKDGVIPYFINGELFDIVKIKGEENDKNKKQKWSSFY